MSSSLSFDRYAFAPQSVLACLEASQFVSNILFGKFVHHAVITKRMILGTVLDELERTNKSTALVTLCIGGGMGTATIIERV